ncbi:MAG TPA: DUF58 domain-containing protein, partial [Roseiflexaceae bacterium]|nr:DUF58 domain-containing protein [Roseiflexaceae bacterium]
NRNLLLLLVFVLVIGGMLTLNGSVVALALPLIVVLGAALWEAPGDLQLEASRHVAPDRTTQATPIEVTLTLTNRAARRQTIQVSDRVPTGLELLDGATTQLASIGPGESMTLRYTIRGQRGLYTFEPARISTADPFELFPRRSTITAPAQLFILPDLIRLRRLAIRPRRTRVYSGVVPARQGGPGIEFFGVRQYQPGDPTRWVNARATARTTDVVFVNEFEQERVVDVGLILDARAASDVRMNGTSLFEYGVQAAAALADLLISQGNRVGLLVYGNAIEWTFPGYGKIQRERMLRALAAAQPGDKIALESFDAIPTRLFPMRSQLILISPLLPDDKNAIAMLRARGYQLFIISPDPVAFEAQALGSNPDVDLARRLANIERDLMLRAIGRSGVHVINWQVTIPFQQIAYTALSQPHVSIMP